MVAIAWPASRARARAIPPPADATAPAAPAARRNDRRLHIVDFIKNLLDLSGVRIDDHIDLYLAAESYASYPVDSSLSHRGIFITSPPVPVAAPALSTAASFSLLTHGR